VIHYGLDTELFAPRHRSLCRSAFGISQDAVVVLFAAHSLLDKRKGFALFVEALAGLESIPNLMLVSLGRDEPAVPLAIPHKHLGAISDDRLLALAYGAADVFVIPSLQESLGQTALEAIACGTPAVGFDVGGIPDVVRPGVTGFLAPRSDVTALRHAILELIEHPEACAKMATTCRQVAVQEFSRERQARDYIDLYNQIRVPPRGRGV
jgi:glycosyltransferase involved in cell wall biosynthesis